MLAARPSEPRAMPHPTYDQAFWEQLWTKTLRDQAPRVAARAPNAQLGSAVA
jgi:hypothetical protein